MLIALMIGGAIAIEIMRPRLMTGGLAMVYIGVRYLIAMMIGL